MVCSGAIAGAPRWAIRSGRPPGPRVVIARGLVSPWRRAPGPALVPRAVPSAGVGARAAPLPDPLRRRRARAARRAGGPRAQPRLVHGSPPDHDPHPPAAPLHDPRALLQRARPRRADPVVPRLPGTRERGGPPGRADRDPT